MIPFSEIQLPKLYRVIQHREMPRVEDPGREIAEKAAPFLEKIKPGDRVGIAAGSRGIYNYAKMIKTVVDLVVSRGGNPYIIPAMGSHGGATAEGQAEVLEGYGITEATMGAPVLSSMETVVIGQTPQGAPVHFDKNAASMDWIVMVNRVKPHTDFHDELESGVMKQMAVGLGKQHGAATIHRRGIYGLSEIMPACARVVMEKMPILMGVAIIENAEDKTAQIEVLGVEGLEEKEKALLKRAKALMPSLPAEKLDVLVLQEMGKNISGTGIDPNIVGRYLIRNMADETPDIYRIVCLDLTDESHHNAIGVGIADVITKRMYEKIDLVPTYMNTMTSGFLERGFIPIVADSDRDAIQLAVNCCNRYVTPETLRLIFAQNTLKVNELVVSEALLPELRARGNVEILDEVKIDWDDAGYLREKLF